jgi:hypothetical protein
LSTQTFSESSHPREYEYEKEEEEEEELTNTFPTCLHSAVFGQETLCQALYISSVSIPFPSTQSTTFLHINGHVWHEVDTSGVFALCLDPSPSDKSKLLLSGHSVHLFRYRWDAPELSLSSSLPLVSLSSNEENAMTLLIETLDALLSDSVRRRARLVNESHSIAILFSGGLDSTLLAFYTHRHLPLEVPIDLINVAFSHPPQRSLVSPDFSSPLHTTTTTTTTTTTPTTTKNKNNKNNNNNNNNNHNNNSNNVSETKDEMSFENAPDRKSARQSLQDLRNFSFFCSFILREVRMSQCS